MPFLKALGHVLRRHSHSIKELERQNLVEHLDLVEYRALREAVPAGIEAITLLVAPPRPSVEHDNDIVVCVCWMLDQRSEHTEEVRLCIEGTCGGLRVTRVLHT